MNKQEIIFVVFILFSCSSANERVNHSNLVDYERIFDIVSNVKSEKSLKTNEHQAILGSFLAKLNNNDPKVVFLHTLSNVKNLNKEVKTGKSENIEYFTTYLGQIKLNQKDVYVFKQFYTVQAAISKHGHSEMIFVDKNGASFYDMEMPENLPIDLKNCTFRYKNKKDTILYQIELMTESDIVFKSTLTHKQHIKVSS